MIVRDVMTTAVETVGPDTPVHTALARLAERGFTALPVATRTGGWSAS
ncbi:CBS domain-containing protein [Pseudonocardia thermophila]|uniref:CBS domain-containing protein n=1 Tax=Pseudonocardia thermophila TaxID=1848 RepID=A0A1M6V2W0_PSETH|nr:CBS domain-containing protein [Pseudonocardia thermophila]SHK75695.1 CBS domain-containing protein [Pseudonocardia thermophila]